MNFSQHYTYIFVLFFAVASFTRLLQLVHALYPLIRVLTFPQCQLCLGRTALLWLVTTTMPLSCQESVIFV